MQSRDPVPMAMQQHGGRAKSVTHPVSREPRPISEPAIPENQEVKATSDEACTRT
jgi:hypothetical protein